MNKPSILITGCSSGIGEYCAKALHQQGKLNVIASCRNPRDVARLKQQGLNAIELNLDDEKSIEHGWQQALDLAHGKISFLFNNAAFGQSGALEDLPTEALRAQFETNLFAWHHLTRLAIKHMLDHKLAGRIVQNSSVLGLVAMPYRGAYVASKFALEGYSDCLRLELQNTPIEVSLIEPGPIRSAFRANALIKFEQYINAPSSRHYARYQHTLQRLAKTEDSSRFTLGPEAVLSALNHALYAKRPKARYFVTRPTYLFAFLRRLLSAAQLDKILVKAS